MDGQQATSGGFVADSQIPAQDVSSSAYQAQSRFLLEAASADATDNVAAASASASGESTHASALDISGNSGELYVALVDSDASSSLAKNNHKILAFRKGDYLLSTQVIGDWHWGHVRGNNMPDDFGYFHPNSVRKSVQVTLKPSGNREENDSEKQDAKPAAVKTEDDDDDNKPLTKDVPIKAEEAAESKGVPSCCQMIYFDQDIDSWKARLRFPSGEVDDDVVISMVFGQASDEPAGKKNPEHARLEDEFGCYIDLPSLAKEGADKRTYKGEVYVRSKNQRILERAGDAIAKLLEKAAAGRFRKGSPPSLPNAEDTHNDKVTNRDFCDIADVAFNPKHRTWGTRISFPCLHEDASDALIQSVFGPAMAVITQGAQKAALERKFGCIILPSANKKKKVWRYHSIIVAATDKSKVVSTIPRLLEILQNVNKKEEKSNRVLKWIPPHAVEGEELGNNVVEENISQAIPDSQNGSNQRKKRELSEAKCGYSAEGIDGDIAAGSSKKPRLSTDASPRPSTSSTMPASYVPVSPELASSARFPLGCHVMHHVGDTVVPGTVSAIYMKLEGSALVAGSSYDVCYDLGNIASRTGAPVRERELHFASRCPVSMDPSLVPAGQIDSTEPNGWIPGTVISSFTSNAEEMESYMVALLNDAGKVSGVPRDMLRYRVVASSLEQMEPDQPALPTAQEDASSASALGSMSSSFVGSTVTDMSTAIVQRLPVPPEIEAGAVKKYLYGDDGSIATKMSQKLGISIGVVGLGLGGIKMNNIGEDTCFGDQQSPCVILKGSSHRVGKATKVISHILSEKAYKGDDKDSIRAQLQWSGDGVEINSSLSGTASPKKKPVDETNADESASKPEIDDSEEGEIMTKVARVEESARSEDEDIPETFEDISSAINTIVMEKGPILVGKVNTSFRQRYGCPIDYRKLGYDKLKDLLIAVPHVYLTTTTRIDNGRADIHVHSVLSRIIKNVVVLIAENSPVSLKDLKPMYRERYRSALDHEKFGVRKLKTFVEMIPCLHMRITGKNTMMIYYKK